MDAALQQQIETLRKLKIKQLKLRYRELLAKIRGRRITDTCFDASPGVCKPAPKAISANGRASVPRSWQKTWICVYGRRAGFGPSLPLATPLAPSAIRASRPSGPF